MHKWKPAINTSHYYALLIVGLFPALIWSSTTFTPDTTGLYERPGDVKFTVEYYQKFVEKGNVELAKEQLDLEPRFSGLQKVNLMSAQGIDFQCYLPKVLVTEEEKKEAVLQDVAPFLEPLRGSCIYRLEGWWTYEFCYGKHVRQFHKNADNKVVAEFYLGFPQSGSGKQEPDYYSEQYVNGTKCDVKLINRSTDIRFRCTDSDVTIITDLKEPSTCQYTIEVGTPLLCKHPKYRKKQQTVYPIQCVHIVPIDGPLPDGVESLQKLTISSRDKDVVIVDAQKGTQSAQSSIKPTSSASSQKAGDDSSQQEETQSNNAGETMSEKQEVKEQVISQEVKIRKRTWTTEQLKEALKKRGLELHYDGIPAELNIVEDVEVIADFLMQEYILQNPHAVQHADDESKEENDGDLL